MDLIDQALDALARSPVVNEAESKAVERSTATAEVDRVAEIFAVTAQAVVNAGEQNELRANQRTTERFHCLAHELRNALGTASMAFTLLLAKQSFEDARATDALARNLARMEALLAETMGDLQPNVGLEPRLQPVHVATVLREVEAAVIPDRGVRLVLELDEGLMVSADEKLLSSAVGNLLHNADHRSAVRPSVGR